MNHQIRPALAALAMFGAASIAHASLYGTGGTETQINDGAEAVHTFTESGTFTLSEAKTVRLLLVGGGGGGGAECGGGGGGGGVVEESAYSLAAGTYTITVGAGGIGGREKADRGNGTERGGQGGDTTIADADGTILLRAFGGGGGGGWENRSGIAGGCGGGAAATGVGGGARDAAQGFDAGAAAGGNNSLPSGGGGAGGASATVTQSKGNALSGTGGPGRESDITGSVEVYGAGGGGGNYSYGNRTAQAPGGDGIGGFGQGNTSDLQDNMKGRDGFGGGGGGGSNAKTYIAGDGGSGIVVVRLANTDAVSEVPVFVVTAVSPAADNAVLTVAVSEAGSLAADGTVAVVAQVADDESAWAADGTFSGTVISLATGLAAGTHALRVTGLRPSHAYVVRLVVGNGGGEAAGSLIAFATTALLEPRWVLNGVASEPGLYQFRKSGNCLLDDTFSPTDAGVTVQEGVLAGGIANHDASTPTLGSSWTDANGLNWTIGQGFNYLYQGWIYLEAGTTYNFFGRYWDGVRLDIDGETVVRSTGENTKAASCVYEQSGWHAFAAWACCENSGNRFGVTPGWTLGLGWNANGEAAPSGKPGDGWSVIRNTEDHVWLYTAPTGRDVDIASWSVDAAAGTATFTAALSETYAETELYAVWGPYHGGSEKGDWAHVVRIGTVGTAAATATYAVADISDLAYFRFLATYENGLLDWSPSQYVNLSNPAIAVAGVTHDGDRATVSIRVDSVGTGDFSLRLLWGEDETFATCETRVVEVDGAGVYSVTIPVTPGATTWYRAEAATTDGGSDVTAAASFTTAAGTVLASSSATVAHHWVTFVGNVGTIGAGTTTVTLWTGDSADALVADPEPITVGLGQFSLRRLFPGLPVKRYWKFTVDNVAPGGTAWSVETPVREFTTEENDVVYTWKADVEEGDWADPSNWNVSLDGAVGYPFSTQTYAGFANGVNARIRLGGYREARLKLDYSDGSVTLCGDDPAADYLYTGDTSIAASLPRSTFALDGVTLSEYDSFDYRIGQTGGTGSRLVVTNGAAMLLGGGHEAVLGAGAGITVAPGSTFVFKDDSFARTNKVGKATDNWALVFAASGESLTVDDGLFSASSLYAATPDGDGGQSFRVRGPRGQIRVPDGIFGDLPMAKSDHKEAFFRADHPWANDLSLVFEPVGGPFARTVSYDVDGDTVTEAVPFVSTADSGRALAAMTLEGSVGKLRISVDASAMRRARRDAKQHFVLWKSGIDTDHVTLVEGKGYALRYTYGWPSTLAEPANAGDLPTGVWAEVPGGGGMTIVVR